MCMLEGVLCNDCMLCVVIGVVHPSIRRGQHRLLAELRLELLPGRPGCMEQTLGGRGKLTNDLV